MCVLSLAVRAHPRWPLLLIGNRDEFHQRPTAALAPWADAPLLGGRDLRAGGSWLATDGRGRLAVLTNVRDPAAAQEGPSRGALVAGFLAGAHAAPAWLDQLQPGAAGYAPFNLLLAEGGQAHWLGNHPAGRHVLPAGVHGLSNAHLNAPWPKSEHLKQALSDWIDSGRQDLTPLWDALADTTVPPAHRLPDTGVGPALERTLGPVFIKGGHYGTRASTIVGIAADGSGFMAERCFGPDGIAQGQSHWRYDGQGRFAPVTPP